MEILLAHCESIIAAHYSLYLSMIVAGLVGGSTHCSVMCSPLVATQMLRLSEGSQSQWLMAYYHIGRIMTYSMLGVIVFGASHLIFGGHMKLIGNAMLFVAGGVFVISALMPRETHHCCSNKMQYLVQRIDGLLSAQIAYLLRGMLMGFMPCGMIVAVLMMVATVDSYQQVILAMTLFGLATVPILQLSGFGMLGLKNYFPRVTLKAGRAVMALNGLFLCMIGLNVVSVN